MTSAIDDHAAPRADEPVVSQRESDAAQREVRYEHSLSLAPLGSFCLIRTVGILPSPSQMTHG